MPIQSSNRHLARVAGLAIAAILFALPGSTRAAFHLWELHEVFSNASGTVQFIEMQDNNFGETATSGLSLTANSDGNIQSKTLTNLGSATPGSLLFATAGFDSLPGGVLPDFTIPANFFNPNATTLTFSFNGSGDSISFSGATLPKNGINSITDNNIYGLANLVVGTNSPTNLLGNSGSINVSPEPGAAFFLALPLVNFLRRRRR